MVAGVGTADPAADGAGRAESGIVWHGLLVLGPIRRGTMTLMRTTLTIDDDLATALKALARRRGMAFKTVVNDAIRRGLAPVTTAAVEREPFRVRSERRGFLPGVDPLRLNQLLDEMDVDAFVERPARDGTPGKAEWPSLRRPVLKR